MATIESLNSAGRAYRWRHYAHAAGSTVRTYIRLTAVPNVLAGVELNRPMMSPKQSTALAFRRPSS
jgi:hypothetical protein